MVCLRQKLSGFIMGLIGGLSLAPAEAYHGFGRGYGGFYPPRYTIVQPPPSLVVVAPLAPPSSVTVIDAPPPTFDTAIVSDGGVGSPSDITVINGVRRYVSGAVTIESLRPYGPRIIVLAQNSNPDPSILFVAGIIYQQGLWGYPINLTLANTYFTRVERYRGHGVSSTLRQRAREAARRDAHTTVEQHHGASVGERGQVPWSRQLSHQSSEHLSRYPGLPTPGSSYAGGSSPGTSSPSSNATVPAGAGGQSYGHGSWGGQGAGWGHSR